MNFYLILGMLLSGSLLAQQAANPQLTPAETPAAMATNAVATPGPDATATNAAPAKRKVGAKKKAPKKSVAKKKQNGSELKTVPLVPGPAVVDANHVNVRGQAKLNSEVVTRLSKDQKVTVLGEVTRDNTGPDEPSAWAKIALPGEVHVWINNGFVDPSTKAVKPKKLNVRSGPGENYSVLGRLERGDVVNTFNTKGDWLEIEAPTNAYAFVAAQYLKQEPMVPMTSTNEPIAAASTVTNEPALAAAATETPGAAPAAETNTNATAAAEPAAGAASPAAPATAAAEEPPPRRVVEREGIVRGTTSIQAPTHFELISPENRRTIDYLYTTSPELDLRRYKGLRIIVTGEEGLEERWGNTPVITIEKIQVLE